MRNRHHSLWSAALMTVLGGIGLASAAGSLDVSDKTCSPPQLPLLASVGVHLDLFAQARSCPEHSYLPGSNFDTTVRLWVLVSTSTLAAGIVGVLLALGAGLWVRRTLRSARDWLHRRSRRVIHQASRGQACTCGRHPAAFPLFRALSAIATSRATSFVLLTSPLRSPRPAGSRHRFRTRFMPPTPWA